MWSTIRHWVNEFLAPGNGHKIFAILNLGILLAFVLYSVPEVRLPVLSATVVVGLLSLLSIARSRVLQEQELEGADLPQGDRTGVEHERLVDINYALLASSTILGIVSILPVLIFSRIATLLGADKYANLAYSGLLNLLGIEAFHSPPPRTRPEKKRLFQDGTQQS